MANFVGKYKYEKSEGFEDYLRKTVGQPGADAAKKFHQNKPYFEVSVSGDYYTFTLYNGEQQITNSFYFDKEFNEKTFYDTIFKTVCKKYDDKIVFVSKHPNGNTSTREYKFTHEGVEANLFDQQFGSKAYLIFKRY
ncbi:probable fatty acid-binding protein [Aphidius gifuensis]|uniref:probable fatty acid-binding protein n=1 Tax=Aphidius gifuensis TaxID=684658 RepID=UPI001CDC2F2E|nr:probable fatty acid-binding protein [Aphidius gifuensis]